MSRSDDLTAVQDDPRRKPGDLEPDWVAELQRLVKCQKMLESADNDLKVVIAYRLSHTSWPSQRDGFQYVASTVDSLIASGSTDEFGDSCNQKLIANLFQQHISQNHDAFLCRSSLFERVGKPNQKAADDKEGRQLSAKLHCLFGIPSTNVGRRVLSTHPHARSRVYDLRNYTEKTAWGPFREDGSMKVDWEMIESLMIVLGYNSNLCCRRFLHRFRPPWSEPLEGVIPERAKIMPDYPMKLLKQPDIPSQLKDPYNISGIWSRVSDGSRFPGTKLTVCRLFVSWITTIFIASISAPRRWNFQLTNCEKLSTPKKPSGTSSWI